MNGCDLCEAGTGDLCEAGTGDLCEVDNYEIAKAHSRMAILPPRFSKVFQAARTFAFIVASLLKVKKLQPFPVKLVVRPEAESDDLFRQTAVS